MPFRLFRHGKACSLILFLFLSSVVRAQLDWDSDIVAFGTDQVESHPVLVGTLPGQFRAFCIRDDSLMSMRRSMDHGASWEAFHDLNTQQETAKFDACSDNVNSYLWNRANTNVWRIDHAASGWPTAEPTQAFGGQSGIIDCGIITDVEFDPDDTYLHGAVLFRENSVAQIAYSRSEDRGQSFIPAHNVSSGIPLQDSSASVAIGVTWAGDQERIWIAVSQDRPGSTGEQVVLYLSDDLGQTWSSSITPDSSSYAQMCPSLLGYENLIMLAYQRRTSASVARDVFVTYSPDGGSSWSEPIQLTDHPYDELRPTLRRSGNQIGLFYARSPIQSGLGELFTRTTTIVEPWVWGDEISISEGTEFRVGEGYSPAGNSDGFAAMWSSRIVGSDTDILFDASWRGTSVFETGGQEASGVVLRQSNVSGNVHYELPAGQNHTLKLYDILGRQVSAEQLHFSSGEWNPPKGLPSGTYLLRIGNLASIRLQLVR